MRTARKTPDSPSIPHERVKSDKTVKRANGFLFQCSLVEYRKSGYVNVDVLFSATEVFVVARKTDGDERDILVHRLFDVPDGCLR